MLMISKSQSASAAESDSSTTSKSLLSVDGGGTSQGPNSGFPTSTRDALVSSQNSFSTGYFKLSSLQGALTAGAFRLGSSSFSGTPNSYPGSSQSSSYYGPTSIPFGMSSSSLSGSSSSSSSSRFSVSSASLTIPVITTTAQSAKTTLITITNCGTQKCSMVIPVVTNYVTYCPLETVVTIISCSIGGCSPYAVSLSAGTTTIPGCFAVATPTAGTFSNGNTTLRTLYPVFQLIY